MTMRLNLTEAEYKKIIEFINFEKLENNITDAQNKGFKMYDNLFKKLKNPIIIAISEKKYNAVEKATETRTKKAKAKIDNAINILRMENKKITHYAIAKCGNVSYLTVKKYLTDDDIITLNDKK